MGIHPHGTELCFSYKSATWPCLAAAVLPHTRKKNQGEKQKNPRGGRSPGRTPAPAAVSPQTPISPASTAVGAGFPGPISDPQALLSPGTCREAGCLSVACERKAGNPPPNAGAALLGACEPVPWSGSAAFSAPTAASTAARPGGKLQNKNKTKTPWNCA